MTPEAQRIAIAEACGWMIRWKAGDHFQYFCRPGDELGVCCGLHLSKQTLFEGFFVLGDCGPNYVIPDYLNDLNAMHAAEKGLFDYQWGDYIDWLSAVLGVKAYDSMEIMHATAAQRAEAGLPEGYVIVCDAAASVYHWELGDKHGWDFPTRQDAVESAWKHHHFK